MRVLRVWGSPREMGFAHGYLIGMEFVNLFQQGLPAVFGRDVHQYDVALVRLVPRIKIPAAAAVEIEGIFEGIKAANNQQAPYLTALDRPLRVEDLVFQHGAGDVYRAFACSGFTVWGERAGNEGVITARNFDYSAYSPAILQSQLILVRQPTGKRQVATITFPGFIGAMTGINDAGVAAFIHDGTGPSPSRPTKQYTPVVLVLSEMLESSGAAEAHERTRQSLQRIDAAFSYMVRVVTPRGPTITRPERVFTVDANGVGENAAGSYYCITTNHYFDSKFTPSLDASESSLRRYRTLDSKLQNPVNSASVWAALRSVVATDPRVALTLHSLVLYPERRRLELSLASWTDQIIPAPMRPPITISFEALFKTQVTAPDKSNKPR